MDIYYCSKVIQILNAINIASSNQFPIDDRRMIILKNFFHDFDLDLMKKHYGHLFEEIIVIDSPEEVFVQSNKRPSHFFTYSDVGEEKVLIKYVSADNVYVYEEGTATYFPTYCFSWVVRVKALLRSRACHMGGSGVIDGLIVHYPKLWVKLHGKHSTVDLFKFDVDHVESLRKNRDKIYEIFNFNGFLISNEYSNIALLSLSVPEQVNALFSDNSHLLEKYDLILINPHPGYSVDELSLLIDCDYIVLNSITEYIIMDLLSLGVEFDYLHDCSSVAMYFRKGFKNIINYGSKSKFRKAYSKLMSVYDDIYPLQSH